MNWLTETANPPFILYTFKLQNKQPGKPTDKIFFNIIFDLLALYRQKQPAVQNGGGEEIDFVSRAYNGKC